MHLIFKWGGAPILAGGTANKISTNKDRYSRDDGFLGVTFKYIAICGVWLLSALLLVASNPSGVKSRGPIVA